MKIAVDALGLPPYGGVRSYALELMTAIGEQDARNEYLVFLSRLEPALARFANFRQLIVTVSGRLSLRMWALFSLPIVLYRENVELLHSLKNLGTPFASCKTVVTIHDLTRIFFPNMFSRIDVLYWKLIQPFLLTRTDRIIAVSQNTKQDIKDIYSIPETKIRVVPEACSAKFRPIEDENLVQRMVNLYELPSDIILYVGGMSCHKNLTTLVRAFFLLKEREQIPHKLVIVGGQYHTHNDTSVFALADRMGPQEVIFTGVVPDEDMPLIYNAADLVSLPSLYEGFGLVALEAMACGIPVIASRAGALPEVIGDAGILIDNPTDESELATAMYQVLSNQALKRKLATAGLRRASLFSWESTAQSTLRVYQEIVSGRGCANK